MDHVYINFTSYLWARTFVGINAFVLNITGIFSLLFRKKLHQMKVVNPKPFVPEELVGRLLLEGMNWISNAFNKQIISMSPLFS